MLNIVKTPKYLCNIKMIPVSCSEHFICYFYFFFIVIMSDNSCMLINGHRLSRLFHTDVSNQTQAYRCILGLSIVSKEQEKEGKSYDCVLILFPEQKETFQSKQCWLTAGHYKDES